LIVVTVPPAIAAPWNTTAYSRPFGAIRASTSPQPNPAATSPPASDRIASSSSPYVITRPEAPSISAGLSGWPAPPARTYSVSGRSGISTSGSGL